MSVIMDLRLYGKVKWTSELFPLGQWDLLTRTRWGSKTKHTLDH